MYLHWTKVILTAFSIMTALIGTLLFMKSTKEKNSLYYLYGIFSMTIAIYIGSIVISSHDTSNLFFQRLNWASGIFSSVIFLYFSYKLSFYRIFRQAILLTLLPTTIFILLILFTNIIVFPNNSILFLKFNVISAGLILFFSVCWIRIFNNLLVGYKQSVGKIRFVILLSIISSFVALLLAVSFDVVFPNYFTEVVSFISATFTGSLVLISGFVYLIS